MDEQTMMFEFAQRPTIKGFPELRWTESAPIAPRSITPLNSERHMGRSGMAGSTRFFGVTTCRS